MLARTLRARSAARALSFYRAYSAPATSVNQVPANDPVKRDAKQTVSETNATPLSSEGAFDKVLQESVARAEELRTKQAPNHEGTWSTSQQPRAIAMQGPRFEQTIMEDQVCKVGLVGGNRWSNEPMQGELVGPMHRDRKEWEQGAKSNRLTT